MKKLAVDVSEPFYIALGHSSSTDQRFFDNQGIRRSIKSFSVLTKWKFIFLSALQCKVPRVQEYTSMFYLTPRTSTQESFDTVSVNCRNTLKLQHSIIHLTVETVIGKARFSFKLLDLHELKPVSALTGHALSLQVN